MTAPTVIKSTDNGAPVCNGVMGQAIILMDYILVTRLGWTKVFSGTNKAVYYPQQKGSENRLFYKIEDSYVSKGYRLSVYESMSDIDNGVLVHDLMWVIKSYTIDTTERPWIAIGDAFGVYFRTQYNTSSYKAHFMGLCEPFFESDTWMSIITGDYSTNMPGSGAVSDSFLFAATTDRIAWRNAAGAVGVTQPSISWGLGNTYPGRGFAASCDYPWEGALRYSRPVLIDTVYRGYLPGFYTPYHTGGFTDLQQIAADGKTFLVLFDGSAATDRILIDISEGFRA